VTHPLYEILNLLEQAGLWYRLDRTRPDAILVSVTAVTERFEISVFADGDIELSRFHGSEDVIPGLDAVLAVVASHKEPQNAD
jgi:hypothetical protein